MSRSITAGFPFLGTTAQSAAPACRYTRGGIVEAGFYIQLINAVLPDLLSVFDVQRMVRFHVFARFARSQSFLNWCREPPQFALPQRFAAASKTIALAVLYAPILPISPIIGLVGIAISYVSDQWLALRVCQTPAAFDADALELAGSMLALLPLAQLLLIYLLYFKGVEDKMLPPFIIGVAIVGLFVILPIKAKLNFARRRDDEDGGTNDRRCVAGAVGAPVHVMAQRLCSLCRTRSRVCHSSHLVDGCLRRLPDTSVSSPTGPPQAQ
jgi:hypothetical protein